MTPEPFGYFKPDPFGWTDCAETDEGARPLYDQDTVDALLSEINTERALSFRKQVAELEAQRDELLAALDDASTSLETIAVRSFGEDSYLDSKPQMRAFAQARANVARAAIASAKGGA